MSQVHPENWPVLMTNGALDAELLADVRALAAAAEEDDGNPPFSEQTLVMLRGVDDGDSTVASFALYAPDEDSDPMTGEDLAGIAVVVQAGSSGVLELAVHPSYRNLGVAGRLLSALQDNRGLDGLNAWSHGNHEAAAELAERFGYAPLRELWKMRLMSSAADLPDAGLPEGITLRAFVPGRDEQAWLAANRAAFAHHPEQGSMTMADLMAREAESWFDPEGFLLAVNAEDELLGFHWTKVHAQLGPHPAMGEVYVVGVTPDAQGLGLGKALTVAGIKYLQAQGLHAVMLYVDADNHAAVALYQKLGFVRWDTDVMYGPLAQS
ncbi:mycothiol synthase [Arthrobacter sp. SIMBA_036]|uniref:mycothiol synthase n=1 Tax=Arthrobacter sp. SIMBA_036 TaxID=3085778 RepID=UPI00397C2112